MRVVCMYVCMYVCMCMYVCAYILYYMICVYIYIYVTAYPHPPKQANLKNILCMPCNKTPSCGVQPAPAAGFKPRGFFSGKCRVYDFIWEPRQ